MFKIPLYNTIPVTTAAHSAENYEQVSLSLCSIWLQVTVAFIFLRKVYTSAIFKVSTQRRKAQVIFHHHRRKQASYVDAPTYV